MYRRDNLLAHALLGMIPKEEPRNLLHFAILLYQHLEKERAFELKHVADWQSRVDFRIGSVDQIVGRAGSGKSNLATWFVFLADQKQILSSANLMLHDTGYMPKHFTFIEKMSHLKKWFEEHKDRHKLLVIDDAGEDIFGMRSWGSPLNSQLNWLNKHLRKPPYLCNAVYVSHDEAVDRESKRGYGEIDRKARMNTRYVYACPKLLPQQPPRDYQNNVVCMNRFGVVQWHSRCVSRSPIAYNDSRRNTYVFDALLHDDLAELSAITGVVIDYLKSGKVKTPKRTKKIIGAILTKIGLPKSYLDEVYAELLLRGVIQ